MDFSHPETIDDVIIGSLATKSENGEVLLKKCQVLKVGFTKQALYAVLRRLIFKEIVIKSGKQFSLSTVWLGKMSDFFAVAQERYGARSGGVDFLSLRDGNKVSYSFKSPEEADRFLGHAFAVLGDNMQPDEPIYIYNPHEWFLIARAESEEFLFKKLLNEKRSLWVTVGSNTYLDMRVKNFFDGAYLQYHALPKPLFEKNYYYVNVFGNFIQEFFIDQNTANNIDAFYKNTLALTENAVKELQSIVSKGKTKVTISNNPRKAAKLKKMLGQYFYKAVL